MKTRFFLFAFALALAVAAGPAAAAPNISADEAVTKLKVGNARYITGKPIHPNQDAARRTAIAKSQNPFATVLTCADSRVPVELLFDQGLGDIFVVRVAGNVSDTDEVGTIEYGVGHLNTPLLVVMGHTGCGAVKAVLEGAQVHGSIPALVDNIAPAVAQAKVANPGGSPATLLDEAVKANVWVSIDDLFKRSSEVREMVKTGKLKVAGAIYDLESGAVNWLGTHPEQARLLAYSMGAGHETPAAIGSTAPHAAAGAADHDATGSGPATDASTTHGAADTHAASATGHASALETEPRVMRWILGTLATLLVVMGAAWFFARSIMTRWQVPQRIAAGFVMVLLVLGGVGFAGYQGLHSSLAGFTEYRADARHSNLAASIVENFMDMRIAAKDLVIFRTQDSVQRYDSHKATLIELLKEGEKEIKETERLKAIQTIESQVAIHAAFHKQLRTSVFAGKTAEAAEINRKMGEIGGLMTREVEELQSAFLADQNHAGPTINRNMKEAQAAIASVGVGALILGIFLAGLISRSIVAPLRDIAEALAAGAEQTAAAAGQVSASSQALAEGASEQAASLEETSASLEEMTSMTKRNSDNAQTAKVTAVETRKSADTGAAQMKTLLAAMDSIKTASEDITKILKSIDEIAFQTNILALNAAVEAARAGEAGAGFAVVADEVRNLAQRCAAAAKETAVKIEDSVKKSQQGALISADVAKSFGEIQTKVRQLDELVAEIASASAEQTQGITQVNTAVTLMDKVTQSNAASAEECASASEELNAQAETLKDSVTSLEQLVGGAASAQNTAPAVRTTRPPQAPARKAALTTGGSNGARHRDNGHAVQTTAKATSRSVEIPMDDDFKNF